MNQALIGMIGFGLGVLICVLVAHGKIERLEAGLAGLSIVLIASNTGPR